VKKLFLIVGIIVFSISSVNAQMAIRTFWNALNDSTITGKYGRHHIILIDGADTMWIGPSGLYMDGPGLLLNHEDSVLSDVEAAALYLPLAGGQLTGNLTFSSTQTVDGVDISALASTYETIAEVAKIGDDTTDFLRAVDSVEAADETYETITNVGKIGDDTANFKAAYDSVAAWDNGAYPIESADTAFYLVPPDSGGGTRRLYMSADTLIFTSGTDDSSILKIDCGRGNPAVAFTRDNTLVGMVYVDSASGDLTFYRDGHSMKLDSTGRLIPEIIAPTQDIETPAIYSSMTYPNLNISVQDTMLFKYAVNFENHGIDSVLYIDVDTIQVDASIIFGTDTLSGLVSPSIEDSAGVLVVKASGVSLSDLAGAVTDGQVPNDIAVAFAGITGFNVNSIDTEAEFEDSCFSVVTPGEVPGLETDAAHDNFSELGGTVGDAQIAAGAVDGGEGGEIADGTVTSHDLHSDLQDSIHTAYDSSQHDYLRSNEEAADVDSTGTKIAAAMNAHDAKYDDFSEITGTVTDAQIDSLDPSKLEQDGAADGNVLTWSASNDQYEPQAPAPLDNNPWVNADLGVGGQVIVRDRYYQLDTTNIRWPFPTEILDIDIPDADRHPSHCDCDSNHIIHISVEAWAKGFGVDKKSLILVGSPYATGVTATGHENPCIYQSNSPHGPWTVPDGLTNPVFDSEDSVINIDGDTVSVDGCGYPSDPNIRLGTVNDTLAMVLAWRRTRSGEYNDGQGCYPDSNFIYVSYSYDLVNWSMPVEIIAEYSNWDMNPSSVPVTRADEGFVLISPQLDCDTSGVWTLYTMEILTSISLDDADTSDADGANRLNSWYKWESADLFSGWDTVGAVDLMPEDTTNTDLWHGCFHHYGNQIINITNLTTRNGSGSSPNEGTGWGAPYNYQLAVSDDHGRTFNRVSMPIFQPGLDLADLGDTTAAGAWNDYSYWMDTVSVPHWFGTPYKMDLITVQNGDGMALGLFGSHVGSMADSCESCGDTTAIYSRGSWYTESTFEPIVEPQTIFLDPVTVYGNLDDTADFDDVDLRWGYQGDYDFIFLDSSVAASGTVYDTVKLNFAIPAYMQIDTIIYSVKCTDASAAIDNFRIVSNAEPGVQPADTNDTYWNICRYAGTAAYNRMYYSTDLSETGYGRQTIDVTDSSLYFRNGDRLTISLHLKMDKDETVKCIYFRLRGHELLTVRDNDYFGRQR